MKHLSFTEHILNRITNLKSKYVHVKTNVSSLIMQDEMTGNRLPDTMNLLRCTFRRFFDDQCMIRANAIAYSVVISIIPLMTVLVKYAAVDRAEISDTLSRFMALYGYGDSDEVLRILDQILQRANTIAGIGSIFTIYAATNIMRHMEDTFNAIAKVRIPRQLLLRLSLYVASLIFLPAILIAAIGSLKSITEFVRPASYVSMIVQQNEHYTIEDNGYFASTNTGRFRLIDRVARDTPDHDVYADYTTGRAGLPWEIVGDGSLLKEERGDLIRLKKMIIDGDRLYVITSGGILYVSNDRGATWKYFHFVYKIYTLLKKPIFEDIVIENGYPLILATLGTNSAVFRLNENGWRLLPLDSVYNRMIQTKRLNNFDRTDLGLTYDQPQQEMLPPFREDKTNDANAGEKNMLYLLGNGRYRVSIDGGQSFEIPVDERFGTRPLSIRDAAMTPDGNMIFAGGSEGDIWIRKEHGTFYPDIQNDQRSRINGIYINKDGKGFLYGEDSLFRVTVDGGHKWMKIEKSIIDHSRLLTYTTYDKDIYLAGDDSVMLKILSLQLSDQKDERGYSMAVVQLETIEKHPLVLSLLSRMLIASLTFLLLTALITTLYRFLPNKPITFKNALIGALLSAIALNLFLHVFGTWVVGFTTTGYIYGVWAVIPVGLLVILISVYILLFGFEMTCILESPVTYCRKKKREIDESILWNAVHFMMILHQELNQNKKALTYEHALRTLHIEENEFKIFRDPMIRCGLLSYDKKAGTFFPLHGAGEVTVQKIHLSLVENRLKFPFVTEDSKLATKLNAIHHSILDRTKNIKDETSIKELLELSQIEDANSKNSGNSKMKKGLAFFSFLKNSLHSKDSS